MESRENRDFDLYKDIQGRTNGKSTFIKRFMDLFVLPNMEDENARRRAEDELPQSAAGKTIMTTEPKFIPQEAASIMLADQSEIKVRLIDCVGFMVQGASGHMEGDENRMVKTPWMERDAYTEAEKTTITKLEEIGKPYVVVLNSMRPYSEETRQLKDSLEKQYQTRVVPVNCQQMHREDILHIMSAILMEFPVTRIDYFIPKWTEMLPIEHPVKAALLHAAGDFLKRIDKISDAGALGAEKNLAEQMNAHGDDAFFKDIQLQSMNLSDGTVAIRMDIDDKFYFSYISEMTGVEIDGEYQMISMLQSLAQMKKEYERVKDAMDAVEQKGYGVVMPGLSDIRMENPVLIQHGGKFGVKMRALSPSIHMIKANIETEIAPIVGSEEQANDLIEYIKAGEESGEGIWTTNIFGKSVGELMEDGIRSKIMQMDDECQMKLQDTMNKIVNDSKGGMVCIII